MIKKELHNMDNDYLLFLDNPNTFSTSSKRRIKKEFDFLYKIYPNILLSCNSKGYIDMTVSGKYKFVFNNFFPFKPPQIYYNGEPYLEILRLKGDFQKKLVKKYKNKDCLCCESYCCDGNWAPSIKLLDVIEEIKSNVEFKRSMVNVLLAEKIKRKYLIADIDINSFLI